MNNLYYYSCLLFVLLLPLQNVSIFEFGFNFSAPNILIILVTLKLIIDYLLFYECRKKISARFLSYESIFLLLPLLGLLIVDALSTILHGGINYLADRVGTVLMVVVFLVGIDEKNKIKKVFVFWLFMASYLALQNILSNLGITPIIEGSRVSAARSFYGLKMPFAYAAGFPGAFGWHGMILEAGLIISIYYYRNNFLLSTISGLLCLSSIIILQSRSTYLAALLSLVTYFLIFIRVTNKYKKMIIIFSPSIILLFFYSVDIINLFENIFVALIDVARGNVDSRLLQFKISFQTGINNSLLGVGHNYLFNSLLGITIHNSFLYQFASLGIAGFTIYCYIYLKSLLVPIKFIKTHDFSHSEHIIIVALLSILTAFCIELSLFRVISGREQWLIMYLILLYCSPMSSEVSKIEETLSKQHYRLTRTRISSTLE